MVGYKHLAFWRDDSNEKNKNKNKTVLRVLPAKQMAYLP